MKTLRFALQIALGIALTLAAQLWDRRRLDASQRAAGWNRATWAAALYALGPLSMLGWCWVTRSGCECTPWGLLFRRGGGSPPRLRRAAFALGLGLVWVVALLLVLLGADALTALALGLPL
jgi:hypothetical protein